MSNDARLPKTGIVITFADNRCPNCGRLLTMGTQGKFCVYCNWPQTTDYEVNDERQNHNNSNT